MKCLDTYALVEIENGNPFFAHLLTEQVVITDITMAEFYADLYRKHGEKTAEYWLRKLTSLCRPVSRDILMKAVKFRIDHHKENLSFFDCVGYLFSRQERMPFVTGDKEFRNKEGVEFISS